MAVRAVLVAHQRAGFMTVRGQFLGPLTTLDWPPPKATKNVGVATVSI